MTVFRVDKNSNYTTMANYHFKDKRLSWKAKGILSLMISLPDDWDYSLAGLEVLSSDGLSSTRTALKELEKYGYLIRRPIKEKGKIKDWEYLIFEKPQEEKPLVENPQVENPQVENRTQLNTNKLNTKESNTENIKYIVDHLNSVIGKSYKYNSALTQRHIKARLNEGFTVEDFKTVINKKSAEWKGTEMEQYLRPETLFGTKFESYLNATIKPRQTNGIAVDPNAVDDLEGIF